MAGRPLLLIGNKSDDTLSFVDPERFEVVGIAATGRGPHELTVSRDGRLAYVANYEGPGDSLSVIDVAAMTELRRIPIDPYRGPHGLAVSRDGRFLYATCERSQAVIELDLASETVTRAFQTDQEVTHMLVLLPDGTKLYTANIRSGTATAIDLQSGQVRAHIETGGGCEGIAVSPDGRWVWTANRAEDTLAIIDSTIDEVVDILPCAGFPIRVQFTPDGRRALVSCATANAVAIFDVAAREADDWIPTGEAPIGLLIEPAGRRAYVANTEADIVTVLGLQRLDVVSQITAGRTPDGMAWVAG